MGRSGIFGRAAKAVEEAPAPAAAPPPTKSPARRPSLSMMVPPGVSAPPGGRSLAQRLRRPSSASLEKQWDREELKATDDMSADGGRAASLLGRAERLSDLLAKRSQLGLLLEKYESQLVDIGLSEPSRRTSTCLDAPPTQPGRDSLGSMCSAGPSGRRSSFERVSEAASVLEEGAPAPAPAWEAHNARSVEVTRDRDNIVKVVKKLDVQLRALLDTAAASAPGADGAADAAAERARLRNDQTALARHAFEETPNTEFYDGEEERRMSAWAAHDPLKPLPAAHGANRRTEAPKPKAVQSSGDIIGAMNALLANEKAKAAEVAPEEKAVCRGWTLAGAPGTQAVAGSASAADAPYGMEVAATAALFGKRLRQRAAERHIGGDAGGFGSLSQLQRRDAQKERRRRASCGGAPAPAPAGAAGDRRLSSFCPAPPPAAAPAAAPWRGAGGGAGGGRRRRRRRVCLRGDAMRAADAEGRGGAPADADGPRAEPEAAGGDQSAARRGVARALRRAEPPLRRAAVQHEREGRPTADARDRV